MLTPAGHPTPFARGSANPFALLAAGLSACSINVDETGITRYADYYGAGIDYDSRRIIIEQPAGDRDQAAAIMSDAIAGLRAAGCRTISADSWRRLAEREGRDVRGLRIIASCPLAVRLSFARGRV